MILEPGSHVAFMIDGHSIISPFISRWEATLPTDATVATISVREADVSGVDESGVVSKRLRDVHFLFDLGSNEVAEIATIGLPPEIGLVRESNRRDSGVFGVHSNSPKSEWLVPFNMTGH